MTNKHPQKIAGYNTDLFNYLIKNIFFLQIFTTTFNNIF